MQKKSIGIFVGSYRKESFSRKLADVLKTLLKDKYDINDIDISGLSMFNQDYDDNQNVPPEWKAFRNQVKSLDGCLFVTPEYNRSFPPVLKNALDIASRPYGQNAWAGKPGAIVSVSIGQIGGFGANNHLKQTAAFLDLRLLNQPEAYIGNIAGIMDSNGQITNQGTFEFLKSFAEAFSEWIEKN